MTAPILRCPNETLTEIFHAYVSFSPFKQYSDDPNCARIPAVVRLSHVCGRWRCLVNGTPSLWFSLELKMGRTYPRASLVRSWIQRGDPRSLDFVISKTRPSATTAQLPRHYLDFLLPSCTRLRVLDLDIDFRCLKFLESADFSFPLLEMLHVRSTKISRGSHAFSSLKTARRLCEFTFSAPPSPVSGEIFLCLPKSSLITLLNVRGISFDPLCFLDAVISCPKLEICQLSLPDLSDNLLLGMVELPNLLEMTLQFVGHCGCPEFLDNLILPSLTYLAIEHENPSPDVKNPMPYLPGLVERSPGHFELCVLKLDSIPTLTLCCFRGFLEAVPSLERLELINCSLHIPSLSEVLLVEPHEAFPVLPNLTHLTLLQDPDNAINPPLFRFENCRTTLSEVVYSRWTLPFSDDGFSDCDSDIDFFMHHKELEEFIVSNELLMGGKGIKSEELRLRALESEGLQLDIV